MTKVERLRRRRHWWKDYAQRKRDREMAERRNGRQRCPRKFGRFGKCDALLAYETTGDGRTVVYCHVCDRMWRGLCVDCPRLVEGAVGRARRCAECKAKEKTAAARRCEQKDPARRRRMQRAAHKLVMADVDRRQRALDYKRAWRQANPEKVAAQKRREGLRQSERHFRYHAAYRAAHQEQRFGWGVGHDCHCGTPLTGRAKKCDACKTLQRERAEVLLEKRRGRGRRTDLDKRRT